MWNDVPRDTMNLTCLRGKHNSIWSFGVRLKIDAEHDVKKIKSSEIMGMEDDQEFDLHAINLVSAHETGRKIDIGTMRRVQEAARATKRFRLE